MSDKMVFRKYRDSELMVTDGDLFSFRADLLCTFGHFGWKTGAVCCGGDETVDNPAH